MRKTFLLALAVALTVSGTVSCVTPRPHPGPRWEEPRAPKPPKRKKPKKRKPVPPAPPKEDHRTWEDWH